MADESHDELKLTKPWLVAVWPGMSQVALSAGYYLLAKLEMHLLAEFSPRELFEVEHVLVKGGILRLGGLPRSRFFAWKDPEGHRDIVVFLGEAQPPLGKYAFCHRLMEFARRVGVERVFTFAAMATPMHPEHDSRVFAAATDANGLAEIHQLELSVLEDGQIGGMNGVVLGIAGEGGIPGLCMLGEVPHIFIQFPFPKASLAVLEAFKTLAGIELDLTELKQQAKAVEAQLGELLTQVERAIEETQQAPEYPSDSDSEDKEDELSGIVEEDSLEPADRERIERLFQQATEDRSKAYELKNELDRLKVFEEHEDRFLDLFRPRRKS
jgi:proteasome assembly chaperone (PAC2) family protein